MTRYRKSWTEVIKEVYLGEALKPIDKSVVDAFYYKKEKEGKIVSTDGDTLTKMGIGGQQIAKWVGRKIKITAVSDVKSTESIIKYIRKSIPSGILEEVEEDIYGFKNYPKRNKVGDEIEKLGSKGGADGHNLFKIASELQKGRIPHKFIKKLSPKAKKEVHAIMKDFGWKELPEEVELVEKDVAVPSSIENLKKIVSDKQNAVFMFKDGKVRVDLFSASALVQVYDALKPATKKKFEDMIKTKGGFVKSVDFAFSMAKK